MTHPNSFSHLNDFLLLNNNYPLQEQLKHKKKFNFVQFDAQASAWQEKLVEINEDNLERGPGLD